MRYTRVVILSALYLATVALLWVVLRNWLAEVLQASAQSAANTLTTADREWFLANFGKVLLYPNALGFLISALWLASKRSFGPFVRYVVPTALAGALTIPLSFFILYLYWWCWYLWPVPRFLTLLMFGVDAVLPGFLTAQLLRFPRVHPGETRAERAAAVS
jgi:hypothetical protein